MEKIADCFRRGMHTLLFWALVLAGLGLLFLVAVLPVVRQRHTMDVMVEQMTAKNVERYNELDLLQKERIALVSDPFYIEKLARRNLQMCRAGEMQVSITPASYERHLESAEKSLAGGQAVGLWKVYGTLRALSEDNRLRQVALILGGLTLVAAILLFGRAVKPHETT